MYPLKDYYKILEIPPAANLREVKKAYRALAFKYHPDTNTDNNYAATHFLDIQEAYSILSNPARRRQYDEERWLNGMSNRAKDRHIVTPHWVLLESRKLSAHMATIDIYRMSHSALYDYIFLLLSDTHMAVLKQADDAEANRAIVKELLQATRHLRHQYMEPVGRRLAELAVGDNDMLNSISVQVSKSRQQDKWERLKPLLIAIVAIALSILMYFYARY